MKIAANCVKNKSFQYKRKDDYKGDLLTEEDYQNSFKDIIKYQKEFTEKDKLQINCLIFHNNSDGVFAAYNAWRFLTDNHGKDMDLLLLSMGPERGKGISKTLSSKFNQLKDRHVMILDLEYNKDTLKALKNITRSLINFIGHGDPKNKNDIYVDKIHAPCTLTWKFFYPNELVPTILQYIDNNDHKMNLPFLPFSNFFNTAISIRIIKNTELISLKTKVKGGMMDAIDDLIRNKDAKFLIFIGNYMEKFKENLKFEIAPHAVIRNFQGYKVGVINFDAPCCSKVVGREIVVSMGNKIDFAVLWSYQYPLNGYRVQLIDDHRQTKINMRDIAVKLGKIGGHPKGGGGHAHVGNFYWKNDIFDLFNKIYI